LPLSPLSQIILETIERTHAAWKILDEKVIFPNDLRLAIDKQINIVATNTLKLFR
jgi:hypothetical protein